MTTPESSIENSVTFNLKSQLNDGEIELFCNLSNKAFGDISNNFYKEVVSLKDQAIQEALVKLGWTPPGAIPPIPRVDEEDLEIGLQYFVFIADINHKTWIEVRDTDHLNWLMEQSDYYFFGPIELSAEKLEE